MITTGGDSLHDTSIVPAGNGVKLCSDEPPINPGPAGMVALPNVVTLGERLNFHFYFRNQSTQTLTNLSFRLEALAWDGVEGVENIVTGADRGIFLPDGTSNDFDVHLSVTDMPAGTGQVLDIRGAAASGGMSLAPGAARCFRMSNWLAARTGTAVLTLTVECNEFAPSEHLMQVVQVTG